MSIFPPCGVPTTAACHANLETPLFLEMERHSKNFVAAHGDEYARYGRRWVADPLRNWSRQWEYPFVCARIDAHLAGVRQPARILDAGSGFTFFPWFVASRHPSVEVHCCDRDPELAPLFRAASDSSGARVNYQAGDIRALPFDGAHFDAVSCVSVLEHTDRHGEIVREFRRVLKPGGRLIATFDISLDGTRDIRVEGAMELLRALRECFAEDEAERGDVAAAIRNPDVFTTRVAKRSGIGVLPWTHPAIAYRLQALAKGKGWVDWPPELTVFCASFAKAS